MNTEGIREIDGHGLIDTKGLHHGVVRSFFGTGFQTSRLPLTDQIRGSAGRTMAEAWEGNPTAYLGTAVAGFPNCYLIHGPNIGLGHNSLIHVFESQANYIAAAVGYARAHDLTALEPTSAAQDAFTAEVDRLSAGTVWTTGGCDSWYLNANGRNVNLWPGTTFDYRRRTLGFDPAQHLMHRAPSRISVAPPVVSSHGPGGR